MRSKLKIIIGVIACMLIFVVHAHAEIRLLKDINIGAGDSFPDELADINGTLYFAADDGGNGIEIWISNSTAGGTIGIKDINPTGDSSPKEFTNLNGTAIFSADDGAGNNGRELWKSNGTGGGTVLIKDINTAGDSSPSGLTNVNGTVFFAADDDGTFGRELWKSDGTAAGTAMVEDINDDAGSSLPSGLTNLNGMLLFSATDGGLNYGRELWKHDPGAGTTTLVKDINPGPANSDPSQLTVVNGTLFFVAIDGDGAELWKSDGTPGGTVQVLDINPGAGSSLPGSLTNVNGILYFAAQDDGTTFGRELWKSDPGPGGTTELVKDIRPGAVSSSPNELVNFNGTLFFAADGAVLGVASGIELWKSDGSAAGTVRIKDINAGAPSSSPRQLTVTNGTLFFAADGVVLGVASGVELWQSDGTAAGTVLAKDINPGAGDSNPDNLTNVAGVLFFAADDGPRGVELFIATDGTAIISTGSGCFIETAASDIPTD